ncbi:MAG: hypothetical protein HYS27_24380 [Deltaproteobacteria bacterium]|nr:hypothetical protein [Deltaproteobacteria bacterium]
MHRGAALLALVCAACPPPPDLTPHARVRLEDGAAAPTDDPPPALAAPDAPQGVEVFELGPLAMTDGVSPEVLIDVDEQVRSFTLLVSAQPEAHVIVDRVLSPDGALVVDPDTPTDASRQARQLSRGFVGPLLSMNRMVPKRGGGAFIVPNTPDVALVPGTWRARVRQGVVGVGADGTFEQAPLDRSVRLTVLVDTRATPSRARLEVALHFTGASGITAASAANDPLVQQVTSTLGDTFDAVGVDAMVAGLFDVESGDALRTLTLAPDLCEDGDLATLLRALEPTRGAVDVVFVDRMRCLVRGATTLDGYAGLAAAIPGDVLHEGGAHGGVAVALDIVGDDAQTAAFTVAHELGHLLGLFHTMELVSGADLPIYDVISDTPDDPSFNANLMSAAPQPSTSLSDGQAFVLAVNPWLSASAE